MPALTTRPADPTRQGCWLLCRQVRPALRAGWLSLGRAFHGDSVRQTPKIQDFRLFHGDNGSHSPKMQDYALLCRIPYRIRSNNGAEWARNVPEPLRNVPDRVDYARSKSSSHRYDLVSFGKAPGRGCRPSSSDSSDASDLSDALPSPGHHS